MLYVPAARLLVLRLACPLEFSVPDPNLVEPARNVTAPVGTKVSPLTVDATFAENVTDDPTTAGLLEDFRTVEDADWFTTWGITAEVLTR